MAKRLVMTVGVPGAGKTTWTSKLDRTEWLILSLDDFRIALFGSKAFFWHSVVDKHGMDARRYVRFVYWAALRQALTDNKFNIALVNTYVYASHAAEDIAQLGAHDKRLELVIFPETQATLWDRNISRPVPDRLKPEHLAEAMTAFFDPHAWWKDKKYRKVNAVDFKC